MKIKRSRQAGFTTLSWIFVAGVLSLLVLCLLKMAPVYMESLTVKSILNQVAEEARGESLSRAQVKERLSKKLLVNTVKAVKIQQIKVTDRDGRYTIDANYEVRKHLLMNVDVVLVFDDMLVEVAKT